MQIDVKKGVKDQYIYTVSPWPKYESGDYVRFDDVVQYKGDDEMFLVETISVTKSKVMISGPSLITNDILIKEFNIITPNKPATLVDLKKIEEVDFKKLYIELRKSIQK